MEAQHLRHHPRRKTLFAKTGQSSYKLLSHPYLTHRGMSDADSAKPNNNKAPGPQREREVSGIKRAVEPGWRFVGGGRGDSPQG